MKDDEIQEKVAEMKEAQLFLQNIIDATKVDRFKFTEKERLALDFAIDVLNINIKQLE